MNTRTFLKTLATGLAALLLPADRGGLGQSFSFSQSSFKDMLPPPRHIALIVFNGITLLDLVGFYDPISRLRTMNYLPDLRWDLCAFKPQVRDSLGFVIQPTQVGNDLSSYDAVFLPGGFGTRPLQHDQAFIEWIQGAREARYHLSVCTGALILGAAGFLNDRRATTNPTEYQTLERYCGEVVREKVVEDGKVITAGAVSSSIDLGLYLCEKWAGEEARKAIQERMDFRAC